MTLRAIIWDVGGVLVHTEDLTPRIQLADRLGTTREELEAVVFGSPSSIAAQCGRLSVRKHWETVLATWDLPPRELAAFLAAFWGRDLIDMDLVGFIRGLRTNYTTAILSNAFSNLRKLLTERWRIGDAFDHLIISAEVGVIKPDPRIYHLALDRMGIAPAEAVFTDDVIENVEAARALGMHAIHYQNAQQVLGDLTQLLKSHVLP
jgi:putative hydrolase of the HAD superfamily